MVKQNMLGGIDVSNSYNYGAYRSINNICLWRDDKLTLRSVHQPFNKRKIKIRKQGRISNSAINSLYSLVRLWWKSVN